MYNVAQGNQMRVILKLCTPFLAILLLSVTPGCHGSESAERLFNNLMDGYNNLIRPVTNVTDILNVIFGLSISQLIDIDERNQIMTTSVWVKQKWHDYQMVWDPGEYDGLTIIHIPVNMLWMPDILLYNNADGPYDVEFMTNALVYSDGTVYWIPPAIYKSSCKINIEFFPFDEQKCIMKFGSWTHDGLVLDLVIMDEYVGQEDYWENGEWDIVESPGQRHSVKYPCCEETYIDVTFSFVLHRKSLFYIVTLVIPCLLISFLTMLVFYLPSDACEKITLSISILLALIVFLLLISEIIPPTSTSLPLIGRYMLFTMSLVTMSIFATVVVINIHFRSAKTHVMPNWVRKIFIDIIPKYLHMERPPKDDRLQRERMKRRNIRTQEEGHSNGYYDRRFMQTAAKYMVDTITPSLLEEIEGREQINKNYNQFGSSDLAPEYREAIESLNFITNHLKAEDIEDEVSEDWKYVALVIDRILLWIFLIVCVVGTCSILLNSPVIWERANAHATPKFEKPILIESITYGEYSL
ncbi:neuronal acetylcholine receptor subunit beta-4-like [Saccoglossus kowalevskii]|uniref:Neuronal acetylcholine receptor subunit alpha-4-like n=1 Tax=Saccoglossus kowalevskii TaxID=10224 RepID=A0ABM0MW01_SACKO|nr:PREDICTED: neuronal acetylcholine receptor subunit alpha-4-like [Saccoglossus kowalevskii]